MKRLALLLAAMGIVSAAAFAEGPKLEVTNFGQEIEIENSDGQQDIDSIFFANTVGLAYGDWTFSVTGGKFWSYDGVDKLDSINSRLEIDIWNQVTDNLKLGYRLRAQDEYDRHYVRWSYANDWYWSDGDVWYEANNQDGNQGQTDYIESEIFPIGVKFGDLKLGYFLNYKMSVGSTSHEELDDYAEHQIRMYYPLYKGEKFFLDFEGRFVFAADGNYKDYANGNAKEYRHFEPGTMRLYLKPSYKVSDALTVYGYYGYEFKDWEYEEGASRSDYHKENDNYQDIGLGWKYTF